MNEKRPHVRHVIVINLDSVRRDHLGSYDNPWIQTPNIDQFRSRAMRFDQYFLGSYPCLPNRRDIWTGRFEFPFRGWGPIEAWDQTLASQVGDHNVTSMFITDNYFLFADEISATNYQQGFNGWHLIRGNHTDRWKTDPNIPLRYPCDPEKLKNKGKEKGWFDRYLRNTAAFRDADGMYLADKTYAAQVLSYAGEWLRNNHNLEHFFLWVDCFDPHEPWDPPAPYQQMYNPAYSGEQVVSPPYTMRDKTKITDDELAQMRALYAGKVTMTDFWLGRLLEIIEELRLFDNTLVILSTDHGMLFGEHQIIGKPHMAEGAGTDCNLYDELIHIPLLIAYPDSTEANCNAIVQPVDLFATILEAFGIQPPADTHSRSIWPLLDGSTNVHRPYAVMGTAGECISIADATWRLFAWPRPEDRHIWEPLRETHHQHLSKHYRRRSWFQPYGETFPLERALFDITTDPRQQHNIYVESPDIAGTLLEAAREILISLDAPAYHQAALQF